MLRLAAWAAAALALQAALTHAQEDPMGLGQGHELFRQADFAGAKESFEAALEGDMPGPERAVAHVHLAAIALVFDQLAEAGEHVLRAVVHDRAVALPPGAPRALAGMLRGARERLAAVDLGLGIAPSDPGRARLELELASPAGLVAELTLTCRTERGRAFDERGEPPRLTLDVDRQPMRCLGRGNDHTGTAVVELERSLFHETAGNVATPDGSPGSQADDSRPRRLALVLGGTGLVTVAAIVAGVLAARNRSDRATFDQTQVLGWP